MNRVSASTFIAILCLQVQALPVFADTEKTSKDCDLFDPPCTQKIPKGGYSLICPREHTLQRTDTHSIHQDGLENQFQSEPVSTGPITWQRLDQRIIKAIDHRIQSSCQARAHLKLYPLFCKVTFDITRDGEIKILRSTDSGVIMFDATTYDTIKWLKGSDLLTFPTGIQESHRTITAEFSNFPGSSDHGDSALKQFLDGKRQQYDGYDVRVRRHD